MLDVAVVVAAAELPEGAPHYHYTYPRNTDAEAAPVNDIPLVQLVLVVAPSWDSESDNYKCAVPHTGLPPAHADSYSNMPSEIAQEPNAEHMQDQDPDPNADTSSSASSAQIVTVLVAPTTPQQHTGPYTTAAAYYTASSSGVYAPQAAVRLLVCSQRY